MTKRPTKAQRKAKTAKLSKARRIAKALQGYLKQLNPGKKIAGARVRKNKGGSITIVPLKRNPYEVRLSNVPDGAYTEWYLGTNTREFATLAEARKVVAQFRRAKKARPKDFEPGMAATVERVA